MAVHGSGTPLYFSQIANEFSKPYTNLRIGNYTRGGSGIIPDGPIENIRVKTSTSLGNMMFSDYYGVTNYTPPLVIINNLDRAQYYFTCYDNASYVNSGRVKITLSGGLGTCYCVLGGVASATISCNGGVFDVSGLGYSNYVLSLTVGGLYVYVINISIGVVDVGGGSRNIPSTMLYNSVTYTATYSGLGATSTGISPTNTFTL